MVIVSARRAGTARWVRFAYPPYMTASPLIAFGGCALLTHPTWLHRHLSRLVGALRLPTLHGYMTASPLVISGGCAALTYPTWLHCHLLSSVGALRLPTLHCCIATYRVWWVRFAYPPYMAASPLVISGGCAALTHPTNLWISLRRAGKRSAPATSITSAISITTATSLSRHKSTAPLTPLSPC